MKYIISENQYKILLREDRVSYLRNQHVISDEQLKKFLDSKQKDGGLPPDPSKRKINIEPIQDNNGIDLGYIVTKKGKENIKLTKEVFDSIVDADPSSNKQYVQWMIDVFKKYVREDVEEGARFISEDLNQATEALEIFHCVKDRKKFKTIAPSRKGAPDNVKDINKYDSVGQLYLVVSAFSCDDDDDDDEEGGAGKLSKKGLKLFKDINDYAKFGQAEVHKLSDRVIVYQPKTMVASCEPLGNLSNWCTRATPSGGIDPESGGTKYRDERGTEYFHDYRNRKRPGGEQSDYYVIMPVELFELGNPASHDYYPLQLHFESGQFMHKGNASIGDDGLRKLAADYPEVKDYFIKELSKYVEEDIRKGTGLMESKYIDYLNKFGGKAEDVISSDVYAAGVANIRKLASEQTGQLQNNKYLKWLMENTDGVDITDYLEDNIEVLDFSNMNLTEIPDISRFTEVNRLSANSCGLVKLPPIDHLPKKIEVFTMTDNQIKEVPLKGYGELKNCFVMNFGNNPINKINVSTLKELVNESLARFVLTGVDLTKLTDKNKEEYELFTTDPDGIGYLTA